MLCQLIFEKKSFFSQTAGIDYQRLLRSYVIGFGVITPNLYIWYNKLLPRLLAAGPWAASSPLVKTLVGTAFDQLVFVFNILSQFFFFSKLIEVLAADQTHNVQESVDNVTRNLWPATLANWTAWPLITFCNLKFVPVMYQVIVVNFCALFWNLYLAKQNADSSARLKREREAAQAKAAA